MNSDVEVLSEIDGGIGWSWVGCRPPVMRCNSVATEERIRIGEWLASAEVQVERKQQLEQRCATARSLSSAGEEKLVSGL